MAFAVTARHTGQVNDSQTVTTDSVTPTASSLLLLFSAAQNSSHSTAKSWQTPTGGSLTYTSIATSASFNWDGLADFAIEASSWRAAVGASPSAHTVTVDAYSGTAIANYNALTVDITGHNTTTPVTQSKTNGASVTTGDSVSGTVTLDATPAVDSLVVVHLAAGNDVSGAFTAPTIGGQSMTQLHNQSATFCHGGVWYRVITGAESNSVITCSDMGQSVGNWTGIAVEIAAAGGTSATATPAVIACTTALPAAGVNVQAGPSAIAATTTLPRPAVNVTAGPGAVAATTAVPQPSANVTVGAAAIATTTSLPQATAGSFTTVLPSAIAAAATIPAPGVNVGAGPSAVGTTVALPAPGASVTAGPASIAALAALPSASAIAAAVATPLAISTTAALPATAISVGSGPGVITVTVTLPAATTGATAKATSTPTVTATYTSTPTTTAPNTSTSTVGSAATSTSTVT